ncbi:hypothetical protein ACFMQL_08315 [Nonomuraea fastidiosa]|jgi:hypothetical protein|uniref:hypothetical protein n=1 Tax=Nonomuraea TaxID=83681 RepID=UPI00324B6AFE
MWQRGLNWAAVVLVGLFGLMWVGIVIYADLGSPLWMRVVQIVFGVLLFGWAVRKAFLLISRAI